ncbi:DAG1-like protein [Mya arenaria]|uniref:Dystroglycan 1 n=1 Tax=Mya arenaria TaxID=6604 RepID=A0ABY7FUP5_MYAAR|nr:dystroglycan 1-like [Mya arenaria]XP_052779919.1 dystroglycan 1-like [Mya arenaria]XP_052779920.1 dystroglycan 1-like [Mya arenaria]XP_052779921.1 dystroglycan 1-like [Mya arenaria]XP_052779922.1 dystroglycan 1-like [Mya arenaria]XP_052779923.1 dystroglycan 1-like [Mya arenaria]XP_052779924.1 dystroglycan 1-like [Mya arenaria]XP_052779925.1 dystroglycan 1-like [Mya arenaria]XP_052779926.1 dystroglycan 1-like [Mya arenaria]XP_052779927.1 dystroglycan 1-like [Mya arenaria]XP_052779928.1 
MDVKMGVSVLMVVLCGYFWTVNGQALKYNPKVSSNGPSSSSEPLSLQWGIPDSTAYVGKLFRYTLPSDAFQGNIVKYDITEAGKPSLPSWMVFDPLTTELKGIPAPQDKGAIYLEVEVKGDDNSQATDVFSIQVLEDTNGQISTISSGDKQEPKTVRCKREEPQTMVTIVVDCDLDLMHPSDKMSLLENMGGHLSISPETINIVPVGNKPMFDSSALVVGAGNIKEPKTSGALLSWMIGCGQVKDEHMSILHQVEGAAANGDMSSALGQDIVGWHVTNTRFQAKPRRRRAATATPVITPPAPTKVVEVTTTATIEASSVQIMPTKTVEVMPTKMTDKPTPSPTTTTGIQPSETVKMPKTTMPTTTSTLPTTTSTTVKTTPTTTSTLKPTTPKPTTPKPTTPKPTTPKPTTPKPTTKPPTMPPKTKKPTPAPLCPPGNRNIPPRVNNPPEPIFLEVGVNYRKKLDELTFLDCYDDNTNNLLIEVLGESKTMLNKDFFLMVKQSKLTKPYVIMANPLEDDIGEYNLFLEAMNSEGKYNSIDLTVNVVKSMVELPPPNHELSMTLDADYDQFMSDLNNRVELSNKVAGIFGEKNSRSLTVTRLERGSVVYAWTNNSVPSGCPVDELSMLVGKMFNEDGTLTDEAKAAMDPYTVNSAAAAPMGACEGNPNFPSRSMMKDKPIITKSSTIKPKTTQKPTMAPIEEPDDVDVVIDKTTPAKKQTEKTTDTNVAAAGAGGGGGSDIWITTVVPAIVVVIVLIIALTIACCLYRKKRKGKMKLQEKNEFSNNKGVPVIFADEYEEKPNESTRPLILEDEKPPMPPPEYQRASSETSGNSSSTQPVDDRIEEIEMEDTSEMSPLYTPPPPVTATSNNKPPHVHSSRGPPPYVPP